jgi:hypothetical protein
MRKKRPQISLFTVFVIVASFAFLDCSKRSTRERAPACSVSPKGWLDFGQVETCCETRYRSFTITNTGGGNFRGKVTESCDYYGIVGGDSSYSLGADQSQTFTVEFRPGSEGDQICDIETGNGLCPDVFCRGTGVTPPQLGGAEFSLPGPGIQSEPR